VRKQNLIIQMTPETTADKIKIITTRIQVERDQEKKQELQKQLRVLQYHKEIEDIRKRIEQLG
jgi:hypothetical protein